MVRSDSSLTKAYDRLANQSLPGEYFGTASDIMHPDLIFDVGLHKGEDSEFYLKKGFRVVAVEALSELCEISEKRLQSYVRTGQLTIVNAAVAEKAGTIRFFVNETESVWGTALPEWADRNARLGIPSREISVQAMRFADIIARFGMPYYLKIDIEGADLLCLEALKQYSSRPKHVSVESTKTSWQGLLHEFALLKSLGYSKFKAVQQLYIDHQECSYPSREGVDIQHKFEFGASGPFGEDLAGPWLSEKEIIKVYKKIFLRYRLFGDDGILRRNRVGRKLIHMLNPEIGWYDTHATT